ncbi:MAG: hypothetical protein K2N01_04285 [Lachnospiraceae bacterium]|nr:hypothetical protein [Lachnospiraceae bacterium]
MKNRFLVLLVSIAVMTIIAGCSKFEEDTSYDTDLYGTYSQSIDDPSTSYSLDETYSFNKDDTYDYMVNEVIHGEIIENLNKSGTILSVKEISDDITEITLDREVTFFSTQETTYQKIYKYKNMLGYIVEIEVPKGKTFELDLGTGVWFDEDGQYHICMDSDICDCNETFPRYIRKDNIIYFQSMDEEHKNCYTIGLYIVDKGLFSPGPYKQ